MKTFSAKPAEVTRDWYVVDATERSWAGWHGSGAPPRGKHKAEYTPHVDTGDYIIVVNADKVASPATSAPEILLPAQRVSGGIKSVRSTSCRQTSPSA